jgi:predicted neutral ceramidase superfamily lipid hydrolase
MRDVARDPAALELLRVQRSRLADRMRPPWWYPTGSTIVWAMVFAGPFITRYLPQGDFWAIMAAAVAVASLLQWGLVRATGIKVCLRNRPARIAALVVIIAAIVTESLLIERELLVAAVAVAALGVVAEVFVQQAALRGFRKVLRDGGAAA